MPTSTIARKTFNDYLVALQELAMVCNFCLEECAQRISETRSTKALATEDHRTLAPITKPHSGHSNQHMQSIGSYKKTKQGDHQAVT